MGRDAAHLKSSLRFGPGQPWDPACQEPHGEHQRMRYGMVYSGAVPSERCEEGMLESHPEVARIVGHYNPTV